MHNSIQSIQHILHGSDILYTVEFILMKSQSHVMQCKKICRNDDAPFLRLPPICLTCSYTRNGSAFFCWGTDRNVMEYDISLF